MLEHDLIGASQSEALSNLCAERPKDKTSEMLEEILELARTQHRMVSAALAMDHGRRFSLQFDPYGKHPLYWMSSFAEGHEESPLNLSHYISNQVLFELLQEWSARQRKAEVNVNEEQEQDENEHEADDGLLEMNQDQ
jgi:hypothetical protein